MVLVLTKMKPSQTSQVEGGWRRKRERISRYAQLRQRRLRRQILEDTVDRNVTKLVRGPGSPPFGRVKAQGLETGSRRCDHALDSLYHRRRQVEVAQSDDL